MSNNNSIQGLQGIQGTIGVQGSQGYRGAQGLQGKKGLPGYKGLQGVKGVQGTTGDDGTKGVQGLQGRPGLQGTRGCQGIDGLRGTQGVQGLQGKKGYRGATGYMGYIGEPGEVGIQGLQGETGYAVYFDGIRLNGANSNLFVFNIFDNRFVSVNQNFPDLLRVSNGSVIKIWMNNRAFSYMIENNSIPINSLENGENVLTEYPAYYRGNADISELLINTAALNNVVEFTFKDNAWHYSGGIVGGSGGGGEAVFTEAFDVVGMNLGQMTDGTHVEVGERIETVVKKMLVNVIDVSYAAPKANLLPNSSIPNDVEIGTQLNFILNASLIDGYFESSNKDLYNDESFNQLNHTQNGKLNAGCTVDSIEYYVNNVLNEGPNVTISSVEGRNYSFVSKIYYNESTEIAKKNNGEDSSVKIQSGMTQASIGFTGKYKGFYGITEKIISDSERPYSDVFTTKESLSVLTPFFIKNSGEMTVTNTFQSTDAKPSMVLVIPNSCTITNIENTFGPLDDPYDKFKFQNTITYTTGSVSTIYNVYIIHNLFGTEYKNIKIRK